MMEGQSRRQRFKLFLSEVGFWMTQQSWKFIYYYGIVPQTFSEVTSVLWRDLNVEERQSPKRYLCVFGLLCYSQWSTGKRRSIVVSHCSSCSKVR